jgi:tetratricopeptide (TPR) repeat protein
MNNNMSKEDYKKLEMINALLKNDPTNLILLLQKAYVYLNGYDNENTIANYRHIIELYPDCIDAYFWLSYYLHRIGCDPEQAMEVAQEGLKISPTNGGLHAIIAWTLEWYSDKDDEFLYHLKKAIQLEQTWISTRISLIDYFIKHKNFDLAKEEIYKALDLVCDDYPTPKDEMESEYEIGITRRWDSTVKMLLQKWLEEVEKNKIPTDFIGT